jgi:hypothetical protein
MNRTSLLIGTTLGVIAVLGGCAQRTRLADRAKDVIATYCEASELERSALEAQLATERGPLVVIHCENLG